MSGPPTSGNNLLSANHPRLPMPAAIEHTLDSEFYCHYKTVVFLVGNTLFRFKASVIAPDPEIEDYELKGYVGDVFKLSNNAPCKTGSGNETRVVLPADVTTQTFRDLLMFSSGGVTNTKLKQILYAVNHGHKEGYTPTLIYRLSKLGHLASRFGMKTLDSWTQRKIQMMLNKSISSLPDNAEWNTEIVLQIVYHAQGTSSPNYQGKIIGCMTQIMCTMVCKAYDNPDRSKDLSEYTIIRICAELYKDKSLSTKSPDIFGFVFAVILSLGPHSPIWSNSLTREDRRILYAANSILTCLHKHTDLDVGWLIEPSYIQGYIKDCSECSKHSNFYAWWGAGFGKCKGLNSRMPTEDICHIVRLLDYKDLLCKGSKGRQNCPKRCPERLVLYVLEHIQSSYCALARKYKYFEETV
ncbi:hypothetical protein RHS04_01902 [Rhizoctonia solani]|uniref:BTB domain-containing protein n=1 Tax=Rhizoctonia solani TaxID=456999 RepID=A0A8H7HG44_9AGAM|nr:hypothetical protein RHS04_01902 [Rhizoctonia solani]